MFDFMLKKALSMFKDKIEKVETAYNKENMTCTLTIHFCDPETFNEMMQKSEEMKGKLEI